jgi:hypothetical protein
MSDKQNGRSETGELSPASDEESAREKSGTPRSYYYDDATGYEIYEDEDDTETDEPIDRADQ